MNLWIGLSRQKQVSTVDWANSSRLTSCTVMNEPVCHFLCYSLSHNKITDASADMLLQLVSINPSIHTVRWAAFIHRTEKSFIVLDEFINTVTRLLALFGLYLDSSTTTSWTGNPLRETGSLKSGEPDVSVEMCWAEINWCLMIITWKYYCSTNTVNDTVIQHGDIRLVDQDFRLEILLLWCSYLWLTLFLNITLFCWDHD